MGFQGDGKCRSTKNYFIVNRKIKALMVKTSLLFHFEMSLSYTWCNSKKLHIF